MEFSCMLRFLSYSSFDDCYTKSLLMVKVKCALMNNNEQNGRPHSTERTSPPSDPRPRSSRTQPTPETRKICRDFVWGICSMNEHCKYRHELEYESMKSILKFCHDYQNRLGCTRPDCLYLHASREEENLFLTSGVIPRALVERYASMSIQNDQTSQVLPPQMMYISEYGQPPPPPPPNAQNSYPTPVTLPGPVIGPHMMPPLVGLGHPAQISNNVLPPPISTSKEADQPSRPQMTITVKTNLHTAPIISAAVAPSAPMPAVITPPPPPPPLPATRTMTSPKTASPISTGAQSLQNSNSPTYPVASTSTTSSVATSSTQQSQPSTSSQLPAIFDPSRPPPPVPVKRPASTEPEAGPSKAMKLDNETSNETRCESCVELNLRIAMEQQEIEQLRLEEERKRRLYEQRTEEYENGNLLLKSMLSPNMFRVVQEFLDKCANTELTASTSNATPQNIPKQFIFQLMEFLISKCNTEQRTPPTETRSSQGMQTMFASIMELLQNGASSSESRVRPIDGAGSNGISRHTNGPVESLPSPVRYPSTSTRYPTPSPGAATATPPYVPTNGEVASPGTQFQSEPPPPQHQVPYQAAAPAPVPPPPRPFYQPFANRGPGFPPSTAPPPPIPAGPPPTGPPPTGPQPAGPPPVGAPPAGPPSAGPPPAGPLPAGSSPAARSSQTTQPRPPQSPSYQYNARMPHNYYPPFQ